MEYVKFGRTGMDVSKLVLGCMSFGTADCGAHAWTLSEDESRPLIRHALEAGINFLDKANVYSDGTSEEFIGRAIRDYARRDEIVLSSTACGPAPTARVCRARRSLPKSTQA